MFIDVVRIYVSALQTVSSVGLKGAPWRGNKRR
jgi:hypothetical protein